MGKSNKPAGRARPNNQMKKSPGPNKTNLKDKKANKSPLKFVNDLKNNKDAKSLVEKLLVQGKEVKSPGKSPNKNNNKKRNKKRGKSGMAPIVNPGKDNAVTEDSTDEEMEGDNTSEGVENSANSPNKTDKKKKLGLLGAKKEDKENGGDGNDEEDDDNEKDTENKEKGKPKHPKKFCVFVGNLPYDVKEEDVREHFKSLKDGIKAVRFMTDKKTGKGKGFGFLELANEDAYKGAMKMNKKKMGERVIRVEYTTPGKSDNKGRKKLIHNKTKKLLGQKKTTKGKGFNKKKGKNNKGKNTNNAR